MANFISTVTDGEPILVNLDLVSLVKPCTDPKNGCWIKLANSSGFIQVSIPYDMLKRLLIQSADL